MTLTTPAPTADTGNDQCYCPQVTSDDAIDFRDSIAWVRPGDPDGEYEIAFSECQSMGECNDVLDDNPYAMT